MPNLAGLIFSSVSSFALQPERTKVVNKRDNLDTLAEVYTGPAGGEDSFIPAIGTAHDSYNLLTLISASVKQMPALMVEVTLNYQGKLQNSGTGRYTSVPTISRYWQEGEISYEDGAFTYAHRYTGRCVTIAFITNNIPSGNESNLGLAKEFLGFTNEWKQLVSINPGGGFTVSQPPIRKMTCTDVRIEDQGDGWFKVTETYMSRMFPGTVTMSTGVAQTAPPQKQTGPMAITAWFMSNLDGSTTNMMAKPDKRPDAAMQQQAAQEGQTFVPTTPPASNAPGSPGTPGNPVTADQSTAINTSIDPAGSDIQGATAAASASANDWSDMAYVGSQGVPLDY